MATGVEHKFPLQQLTILAFCRLAEPIAFVSVVSYIYVYTEDIRRTEDNAAFYSGLLISAFAVAEVFTAFQWGKISDKYGRKPIVLFALAGTALSNLIFGFATNYWVALASRFLGGLLNGNVAVMQTMVAEMCKRPEHEPRAYSMIPFIWSVGSITGAAMGGYLAKPSENWPRLFPPDGIFGKYPYLLPNVVSVAYFVFAILLGVFFLHETNDKAVSYFNWMRKPRILNTENTPLLSEAGTRQDLAKDNSSKPQHQAIIGPSEPLTAGTTIDIRRISTESTDNDKPLVTAVRHESDQRNITKDDEPPHKYSKQMILLTIQLVLMAYHSMAYNTLIPPFLVDEPLHEGLDLQGGIGLTLRDVGSYLAIGGILAMFIQVIIFPPFVKYVGVWNSFFWLAITCPIAYLAVPFLTALSTTLFPWGMYADLFVQDFFCIVLYPCLLILLKNATPSMAMLGQVNGLAMAASSGARTLAPPLVGAIYGNGGSAAGWWSVAVAAMVSGTLLLVMKRPQEQEPGQSGEPAP